MIECNRLRLYTVLVLLAGLATPGVVIATVKPQRSGVPLSQGAARVLILLTSESSNPRAEREAGIAFNALSSILVARGYSVDIHKEASERRANARKAWNGVTSAVLSGARKAGDEIIIVGLVSGTPIAQNNLGGLVSYRATLEIRAYSAYTGNLLANVLEAESGLEATSEAAMMKAVSNVAKRAGENFADQNQKRVQAISPGTESELKRIHSDVDKPLYTTAENIDSFAVIVGVEKYESLPAADFAQRDAEAVRAHLMAMGYPARNIFFLSGPQATRARLAQSVNTWLPSRVGVNSTVFFYFSGHGAPDPQTGQAYLVPTDGDAEDLDSTAYPMRELYAKLGNLKARRVIVVLDSCFSGIGGRSVLAKGTRPLVSKIDLGVIPEKVIALTASDKGQISGTIEDQGHGTFTYYLLKGLDGTARNDTGSVTVQSLYDYLTPKVQDAARLRNRDQTPQLFSVGSERSNFRLR